MSVDEMMLGNADLLLRLVPQGPSSMLGPSPHTIALKVGPSVKSVVVRGAPHLGFSCKTGRDISRHEAANFSLRANPSKELS